MPEKMVSLSDFLEEMVSLLREKLESQQKEIENLQNRIKIMEKVMRETTGGKVKSSILDELKK